MDTSRLLKAVRPFLSILCLGIISLYSLTCSASIISPIAFGRDWGQASIGFGYVNHWIGTTSDDAFAYLAVGFGRAKYLGLEVTTLVDSVSNEHGSDFGANGTVGFKLFHEFDNEMAIAIGTANTIPWGVFNDFDRSYYIVGSKIFVLGSRDCNRHHWPLLVSVGAGSGAYHSPLFFRRDDNEFREFASASLFVRQDLALNVDWAARNLALGISVIPFTRLPIVVGASVLNVAGQNSHLPRVFLVTVSYGYHFL